MVVTKPMLLAEFERMPPIARARIAEGLASAIDTVAAAGPASHGFLRYGWYAAALAAYGGSPRTLVVEDDGVPVIALPFVGFGPGPLHLAAIPGSYWPFRSFPVAHGASEGGWNAALAALAGTVNGLRIGPVYDDDPGATPLIVAARRAGWCAMPRFVADSWLLDMTALRAEGTWPRGSTLRKNRQLERQLGERGTPEWLGLRGADWPAAFDRLAAVEAASWIASRTDGRDAKFTEGGHGAFWRAAAADPEVAAMMHAALLTIDGRPVAFSFDIDAGDLTYAIANSYDPAFAKQSPGKLLYYRNLGSALDRGIARVDWGAGDSGYKQVIGATKGPAIRDWLLLRPGAPAWAGRMLRGLWARSGQRH